MLEKQEDWELIHKLSRATSYLQTFTLDMSGKEHLRSYATGFFIRSEQSVLLITNWHVVTGLDPTDTSKASRPTPVLMKATVISKSNTVTQLTLPLYDKNLDPIWREHSLGSEVDLAIYALPSCLDTHFDFIDIHSAEDQHSIDERVANDVFILGYPFSKDEFSTAFGEESPYYVPVWKRGSIAFEPDLRLSGRVLLIDALSRSGMSGAPVLLSQDVDVMRAGITANEGPLSRLAAGDLNAIHQLDAAALRSDKIKKFRLLGVYSGTFGNTKLPEIALGKCWHVDTLREAIQNPRAGQMPAHAPFENEYYTKLLDTIKGKLVIKDSSGCVIEELSLSQML